MMKKIVQRALSPPAPFFRKLRNISLGLAAVSAAILTVPVSMPLVLTTMAGYIATAGTAITAVCQLTEADEGPEKKRSKQRT